VFHSILHSPYGGIGTLLGCNNQTARGATTMDLDVDAHPIKSGGALIVNKTVESFIIELFFGMEARDLELPIALDPHSG
jgi:hypothetical protein